VWVYTDACVRLSFQSNYTRFQRASREKPEIFALILHQVSSGDYLFNQMRCFTSNLLVLLCFITLVPVEGLTNPHLHSDLNQLTTGYYCTSIVLGKSPLVITERGFNYRSYFSKYLFIIVFILSDVVLI